MVDESIARGPLPFDESPSLNAPNKDALRYPSATCRALASNVLSVSQAACCRIFG